MNKLVEALEWIVARSHRGYEAVPSCVRAKAEEALAEYIAEPSAPAQKTFTDEEGREWRLLDFGYGTASDLRLQLRLGAGLFDSQVIEVSRITPTAPPTDA